MKKILKNLFDLCFTICFIYLWYQGFVLFLKFAWDCKYLIVDDPALWALFLLALFFMEFYNRK